MLSFRSELQGKGEGTELLPRKKDAIHDFASDHLRRLRSSTNPVQFHVNQKYCCKGEIARMPQEGRRLKARVGQNKIRARVKLLDEDVAKSCGECMPYGLGVKTGGKDRFR